MRRSWYSDATVSRPLLSAAVSKVRRQANLHWSLWATTSLAVRHTRLSTIGRRAFPVAESFVSVHHLIMLRTSLQSTFEGLDWPTHFTSCEFIH